MAVKIDELELQIKHSGEADAVKSIDNLTSALGRLKSAVSDMPSAEKIKDISRAAGNGRSGTGGRSTLNSKTDAQQLGEAARETKNYSNAVRGLSINMRSVTGVGKSMFKTLGKATTISASLGKLMFDIFPPSFLDRGRKAIDMVQKFAAKAARVASIKAIRKAISYITKGVKEGIDSLYQWSAAFGGTFAKSMDSIASSSAYLKAVLGTTFSPIINAIAPAVEYLTDRFVDLLNAIQQVFAALTGANYWTKATRGTVQYADALGGAADAAEKMNVQLMKFDEINNITTPGSGGGGGGSTSNSGLNTTYEELGLPDWAQAIKDAIDNGDWAGAGAALGAKINSVVDGIDSYALGQKLAGKINNGLSFVNGFLTTTNFYNIGKKVADFLNGAIDDTDWALVGQTIANKTNAIINTALGLVENFHFTDAGTAVGTAIANWLKTLEWKNLGKTWSGAIGGVVDFITAAFDQISEDDFAKAITDFMDGLSLPDLGTKIGNAIGTALNKIPWASIGSALGDIAEALVNCLKAAVKAVDWGELASGIAEGIGGLGWEGIFLLALPNLTSGLTSFITGSPLKTKITSVLSSAASTVAPWVVAGLAAGGLIGFIFEGLLDLIGEENWKNFIDTYSQGAFKTGLTQSGTGYEGYDWFYNFDTGKIESKAGEAGEAFGSSFVEKLAKYMPKPGESMYQWVSRVATIGSFKQGAEKTGGSTGYYFNDAFNTSVGDKQKGIPNTRKNILGMLENDKMFGNSGAKAANAYIGETGNKESLYKAASSASSLGTEVATNLRKGGAYAAKGASAATAFTAKTAGLGTIIATAATIGKEAAQAVRNANWSGQGYASGASWFNKWASTIANGIKTMKINNAITGGKQNIGTLSYGEMAQGGFVDSGQYFLAREAGPELVGRIGNRTAVANNDQIVAAVASGVRDANAEEIAVLREQNNLLRTIAAKNTNISLRPDAAAGRWVRQAQVAYARVTG